jgi:hypothetical protein
MKRVAAAMLGMGILVAPAYADDLADSTWTVYVIDLVRCPGVELGSSNRFNHSCRVTSKTTLRLIGNLSLRGDQEIVGTLKVRQNRPKVKANCRVKGDMTWSGEVIKAVADCGDGGYLPFEMVRQGASPWQDPVAEDSEPTSEPTAAAEPEESEEPPPEGATVVQTKEHTITATDGIVVGDE